MKRMAGNIAVAMMCTSITSPMMAQKTVVGPGQTETATATIRRIDLARRFVLLRDDSGSEMGMFVPTELTRVKELKVGDTVTFTYYESVVYRISRPRASKPRVSEEVAATESPSALPGGTLSRQVTERVTVKAVDREAPSITVTDREGQTVTRRVDHLSDLDGVKAGDSIDITYTLAVLAAVTRAK